MGEIVLSPVKSSSKGAPFVRKQRGRFDGEESESAGFSYCYYYGAAGVPLALLLELEHYWYVPLLSVVLYQQVPLLL